MATLTKYNFEVTLLQFPFFQREIHYEGIIATVVECSTLCLLVAVVAAEDIETHQMDVKNAFVIEGVKEEVFMEQA